MIFKIVKATAIKAMVIRCSVELFDMQGTREILHSAYDVVLDVQDKVNADTNDDNVRLSINGDAIMQELTNSVGELQLTAGVAANLVGARWNVVGEEDESQALPDQSESSNESI